MLSGGIADGEAMSQAMHGPLASEKESHVPWEPGNGERVLGLGTPSILDSKIVTVV